MSLYNAINGFNRATFWLLPMLDKHPNDFPRFRDCFTAGNRTISVYTRVGGRNREDYEEEIRKLRAFPEYIKDYDDDFDSTYATFVFKVPDIWAKDYDLISEGKIKEISIEYKNQFKKTYPDLANKFDKIFDIIQMREPT